MQNVIRVPLEHITQAIADKAMRLLPDHDRLSVALFHRQGIDVSEYVTTYEANVEFPEVYRVLDHTAVFYFLYDEDKMLAFSFGVYDDGSFGHDILGGICIDPSYQGKGLSYKMMNYVINEFGHAWFQHKDSVFYKAFELRESQ